MKNTSPNKYNIKQLLRQFYQIHDAITSPQKPTKHNSSKSHKRHQSSEEKQQQQQDKQNMMRTISTQIMDSKLRIWEESTLRQIQEKSEGEENSNCGSYSIEKYSFQQEDVSQLNPMPTRYPINPHSPQPHKHQHHQPKQPKNRTTKPPQKKKPKKSQLIVSLKYVQSKKLYNVGMNMLNKQWFKCLDNIHKR